MTKFCVHWRCSRHFPCLLNGFINIRALQDIPLGLEIGHRAKHALTVTGHPAKSRTGNLPGSIASQLQHTTCRVQAILVYAMAPLQQFQHHAGNTELNH